MPIDIKIGERREIKTERARPAMKHRIRKPTTTKMMDVQEASSNNGKQHTIMRRQDGIRTHSCLIQF